MTGKPVGNNFLQILSPRQQTVYNQALGLSREPDRYREMTSKTLTVGMASDRCSPARYSSAAKMFHWSIAVLILIDFGFAVSFSRFNPGDLLYFTFAYPMHMSAGLAVLASSAACVVWRLLHKYPPLPRSMNIVMRMLAKTAHALLYVFIIAVPVTGWAILSVRKKPPVLFGRVHWPNISYLEQMTPDQRRYYHDLFLPTHIQLSYIGMSLVGLHIAAALYHHFFRRDDVLMRMWPGGGTRSR